MLIRESAKAIRTAPLELRQRLLREAHALMDPEPQDETPDQAAASSDQTHKFLKTP
jgi:hypothetical protein